MNFPQFTHVVSFNWNGQYVVQGCRCYIDRSGLTRTYPPETFLTTSDRERAHKKEALLIAATARI